MDFMGRIAKKSVNAKEITQKFAIHGLEHASVKQAGMVKHARDPVHCTNMV